MNLSNCFDEKDFLEDYRARTELRQKLNRLISSLIPRVARFAILFIDDLDRCRPEFAIRFLEQTKAIFQLPNVIVFIPRILSSFPVHLKGFMVLILLAGPI